MASRILVTFIIGCVGIAVRAETPVYNPYTVLGGYGLFIAQAGKVSSFQIENRDVNHKLTTGPGNQVKVVCRTEGDVPYNFCHEDPKAEHRGNGIWEVEYVVGSIWSKFTNPTFLPHNSSNQPLPDQYFFQGENYIDVYNGDPLTEVHHSPFSLRFQPAHDVSGYNSYADMQPGPFTAGRSEPLALLSMIKDRFANVIRRSTLTDDLEPVVKILEVGTIHPDASYMPPELTLTWINTNWYLKLFITCYTVGTYSLQIGYRKDVDTLDYLRLWGPEGVLVPMVTLTCEPDAIDTSQTYFESNWTTGTMVGDVISVDAQFMDKHGNAGYLVERYVYYLMPPMTQPAQSGNLTVRIIYKDNQRVLSTNLNGTVPGLVHTSFKVEEAGDATMVWSYESEPDAYYSLFFLPSVPDVRYCSVDDSLISETGILSVAGEMIGSIEVLLKDRNRDPVAGNIDLLKGVMNPVGDPSATKGRVAFTQLETTGKYRAILEGILTQAGTYEVRITYDEKIIDKGLQEIHVSHSPDISAEKSDVRGTGIGIELGAEDHLDVEAFKQPAGRNLSIIVDAVDTFGNPHYETSPMFELNAEFQEECEFFEVKNGEGATRFSFKIERKGVYYLEVFTAGKETVYKANLEIVPAGVSHNACEIVDFEDVVAGRQGKGYLKIRDTYNNMYDSYTNTNEFEVSFRKASFSEYTPSILGTIGGPEANDAGNRVTFNLTESGIYTIKANWVDWPVQGSDQNLEVFPGPVSAEKSDVRGTGIGIELGAEDHLDVEAFKQPAGRNLSIIVDAVDTFGNPHYETSPMFELNAEFQEECEFFEVRNGGGATRFSFKIERKGVYYLEVFTAGKETVYKANLEIVPAGVSHNACEIVDFEDVVAGRQGKGYLKIRDTYNNMYDSYTDINEFEVSFRKASFSAHTPSILGTIGGPEANDAGNRVTFNLTESGIYTIKAKWVDWPVQGSDQNLEVFPGPVSAEKSQVSLSTVTALAGVQISATLLGYDAFGNKVTALTFLGSITAREMRTRAVTTEFSYHTETSPSEPWKVQMLFNFTRVGVYQVFVFLAGEEVNSRVGPYRILPAGFDPIKSQVTGPGIELARVQEWNNVTVIPQDAYGNSLLPGAIEGQLLLSVQGITAARVSPFSFNTSAQYYTAGYFPSAEEVLLVVVTFQGGVLPGFPVRVRTSGANMVPDGLSTGDLASLALAKSEIYSIVEEPSGAPDEYKGVPLESSAGVNVDEETPRKNLDNIQDDALSAKCPGELVLNCGEHGYMLYCECICDPGWFTTNTREKQGGTKYCNEEEEESLAPAPAPAPAPFIDDEDPNLMDDVVSQPVVALLGAGALLSIAVFLFACLCCKKVSDDCSDDSDSEASDSKSLVLHGNMLACSSRPRGEKALDNQYISAYFPEQNSLWEGGVGAVA